MFDGKFVRVCMKFRAEAKNHGSSSFVGQCRVDGDWIVVTQENRDAVYIPLENVSAIVVMREGHDEDMRKMNDDTLDIWVKGNGAVGGRG